MRLILLKKLLLKFLHINVIPSQVVPFRSNTPLEAFLPSLEAMLKPSSVKSFSVLVTAFWILLVISK